MPALKYLDGSYDCATAIKGPDYIRLLDENGVMVATFDNITDFSGFVLENGSYTSPTADHDCHVAVVRDDGTIGKGGHPCADIGTALTTASAAAAAAAKAQSTADGKAASSHTHTTSQITDFPSSMPASDVYSWAKQATKPTYTASEVGVTPVTSAQIRAICI